MTIEPVSYHGGHSGQFCCHAKDSLEDIILKYIRMGFKRVGITEHVPPVTDDFLYPDEIKLDLTAKDLSVRFKAYFNELKRLKTKYSDEITIYAGMETETVTGFEYHIKTLIKTYSPDYIVGSVHHVNDICFDYSNQEYQRAVKACGGIKKLYHRYFDLQHEMITVLNPFVVGHFDLIRIFDPDYEKHLTAPSVDERIDRNLDLIQSLGLVMDFNLRPLARREKEPYISRCIMEKVKQRGIQIVPGDDAHSIKEAGSFVDTAINIMVSEGFSINWPEPRILKTKQDSE